MFVIVHLHRLFEVLALKIEATVRLPLHKDRANKIWTCHHLFAVLALNIETTVHPEVHGLVLYAPGTTNHLW